jgi:hypothetical protein
MEAKQKSLIVPVGDALGGAQILKEGKNPMDSP